MLPGASSSQRQSLPECCSLIIPHAWSRYEDEFGTLEVQDRILFKSRSFVVLWIAT
jgi:hypothetical protein